MDDAMRDLVGPALGRLPSGLFICSCGAGDESVPFVASWVQQVAMEPAAVSVSIEESRPALQALEAHAGAFTLTILPEGGHELMRPFFRGVVEGDPFGGLPTGQAPGGGRYLQEGLGWLECQEISRARAGSHVVVIGQVLAGALLQDAAPIVHIRKTGFSY